MKTTKITAFLLITIFSFLHHFSVSSFEYQVNGNKGWVVPAPNDTRIYNDWASENRFQAGDTIRFKYRKDSVMEVSAEDYKKCNSSFPSFFSNTGNTVYTLNHPGIFYFISGVTGHCQKGQKMIIKVMYPEEDYSNPSHGATKKSSAFSVGVPKLALLIQLALSYVSASCFFQQF